MELENKSYSSPDEAVSILIRQFLLYMIVPGVVLVGYTFAIKNGYAETLMRENGPVEWMQVSMLVLTAIMIFFASRKSQIAKEACLCLMLMPVIALIRELDKVFDSFMKHSWKLAVLTIVLWAVWNFAPKWNRLISGIKLLTKTKAIPFFWVGIFIIAVFARLIAQRVLWEQILEENYVRMAHRFLEESCELLGYAIILFGAIELFFEIPTFSQTAAIKKEAAPKARLLPSGYP